MDASDTLTRFLAELIQRHHRLTTRNVTSRLVEEVARRALSEPELVRMLLLLLAAAIETTVAGIGNMFACLLRHPDAMSTVKAAPICISGIVWESLRYEPTREFRVSLCCAGSHRPRRKDPHEGLRCRLLSPAPTATNVSS